MDPVQAPQLPKHHGNPFLRIIALLLFAFSIAALSSVITFYFINQQFQTQLQSNQAKQQAPMVYPTKIPNVSSTPAVDETANWKTYENNGIGVSFKYPASWTLTNNSAALANGVTLKGTEGLVDLAWGGGFGGGCQQTEKILINNEQKDVCHNSQRGDGIEEWGQIYWNLKDNKQISLVLQANPPLSKNHNIILKILSTFTLKKQ